MADEPGTLDLEQPATVDINEIVRRSALAAPPSPSGVTMPRQQAVLNATGGPNTTTPIITGGNTINVQNIIGQALQDYQDATRKLMTGGDFGIGAAASQLAAGITAQSQAQQQKTAIDFATDRRVQQLDNADRARFGIIGDGGSGTMAGLADAVKINETLRQGIAGKVQHDLSIRFDEDPLGWLMKQFTLPGDIAELSRAEESVGQNLSVMKGLQELMDARHRDNLLAAKDTSVAAELNARTVIATQAQIDLAKVATEAAKNAIQVANIRTAASKGVFDALREANNTQNANLTNELNFQHLGEQEYQDQLQAQRNAQQQQINDLNIADKEAKQAAETKLQSGIDAAIKLGTVPAGVDVKLLQIMPAKQREFVLEMATQALAGEATYGYNIADAIDKAGSSPYPLPQGTAELLGRLGPKVVDVMAANGGDLLFKQKPKQEQLILLNEGLKKSLNNELKGGIPDSGGTFSPGSALSVAALPILQNNPVMQQVATMAAGNTTYSLKAQDVMAAAASAVANKKVSIDQAAESVAQIYQAVILDNNQKYMYNRLRIPGLDENAGFNARVQFGSVFTNTSAVNMASAIAVKDALTKTILRQQPAATPSDVMLQGLQ